MSYMKVLKNAEFKKQVKEFLKNGMEKYSRDAPYAQADEDSLTQAFISAISGEFKYQNLTVHLRGYKTRGRGPNATEKKLGADGLGIVYIETSDIQLHGFFLFQAKKSLDTTDNLGITAKAQCQMMLSHTAASHLLVLRPDKVSFVGATAVVSSVSDLSLVGLPYIGFPSFFKEILLHSFMLAPLEDGLFEKYPDLSNEIRHILAITINDSDLSESKPEKMEGVNSKYLSENLEIFIEKEIVANGQLESITEAKEIQEKVD
jgi:hypothetical protein